MDSNQYGIIEALSFKLSVDFVRYLDKNRIVVNDIRMDFYDNTQHEYLSFSSLMAMQNHLNKYYLHGALCNIGKLVSIQSFKADSNAYNFSTSYNAFDVSGNSRKLISTSSYDIQRNKQQSIFKKRQVNLINDAINDYVKFYSELKRIFSDGIYSTCYSIPGWSENTWWLNQLRVSLNKGSLNNSEFPYNNSRITKRPPI